MMPQKPDTAAVTTPPSSWRDLYPVHPCADIFPMMSEAELEALAKDIKANGLMRPIVIWRADDDVDAARICILDGRNRLAAMERLGVTFTRCPLEAVFPDGFKQGFVTWNHTTDPAAYVISANIRRRHLSKEQQAELIVKTIEAGQMKNDRATTARSFSPSVGKKGGSTKDPVLAKAVTEAKKHGISKRTVQTARAKVQGKSAPPRKFPKPRRQKLPLDDKTAKTTLNEVVGTTVPSSARVAAPASSPSVEISPTAQQHVNTLRHSVTRFLKEFDLMVTMIVTLNERFTDEADRRVIAPVVKEFSRNVDRLAAQLETVSDALSASAPLAKAQ